MRRICTAALVPLLSMVVLTSTAQAELKAMTDDALDEISGQQALSEFTIENNTARVFLDIHVETYTEVDSLKMGYYPKSDRGTYDYNYDFSNPLDELSTTKYSALGDKTTNGNYAYVREYGATASIANRYVGLQGDKKNNNFVDWDINWTNVKLGKSVDEPMFINGLIMKVEFDDINSPDKKLKRVVVGTNDMQGQLSAVMKRTSGMINPLLTTDDKARELGSQNPANGNPFLLKRDSFMRNWDEVVLNSGDNDTGMWMILNFQSGPNGETDHIGWEIVAGYDERAIDFSYTDGIENIDLSGY